jgi:hypothetical protein
MYLNNITLLYIQLCNFSPLFHSVAWVHFPVNICSPAHFSTIQNFVVELDCNLFNNSPWGVNGVLSMLFGFSPMNNNYYKNLYISLHACGYISLNWTANFGRTESKTIPGLNFSGFWSEVYVPLQRYKAHIHWCLNLLGILKQNPTDWVVYKQQKYISHSIGG